MLIKSLDHQVEGLSKRAEIWIHKIVYSYQHESCNSYFMIETKNLTLPGTQENYI